MKLKHDYYAVIFQIWMLFIMIVLSIKHLFEADSAILVISGSLFNLISLLVAFCSRSNLFTPFIPRLHMNPQNLMDMAHFFFAIALMFYASAAVSACRWRKEIYEHWKMKEIKRKRLKGE